MNILLNISPPDKALLVTYTSRYLKGHQTKGTLKELTEGDISNDWDLIIVANNNTCKNLTGATIGKWAGGRQRIGDVPVLYINPLMHYYTIPYGKWLHQQYINKIKDLDKETTELTYQVTEDPEILYDFFATNQGKQLLAIDIETDEDNLISCIGYSFWGYDKFDNLVVTGVDNADLIRQLKVCHNNNEVPVVFHNGCFDNFYFGRYHMPVKNWYFDTEYYWNAWQAEQQKSLSYISSILLYDFQYWKDDKRTKGKKLYEYCIRDTQNTARCMIKLLEIMPDWGIDQAIMKFKRTIPALYTAYEGFKVNTDLKFQLKLAAEKKVIHAEEELNKFTKEEGVNFKSPQQVSKVLFDELKATPIKGKRSTDETSLLKISQQGDLVEEFCGTLLQFRKESKAISTYYDAYLVGDRLLYSLHVDGTETDRMSCSQAPLWIPNSRKNMGAQLQNIPSYMKPCLIADEGWTLINADYAQADARGVAYLSQDEKMIQAIENVASMFPEDYVPIADENRDFYCWIIKELFGKYITKSKDVESDDYKLRQFMKKVIHGTNYLMGINTLIESSIKELGVNFISQCMKILEYKGNMFNFIKNVLSKYFRLFPKVKQWWEQIKVDLQIHDGILTTPDGWKRIFYGDLLSHTVLRSAVAHQPQHLTVTGINRTFQEIYYKHRSWIRLKGQVHDSIICQTRDDNVDMGIRCIYESLYQPINIHGRDMYLPVEISVGKNWGELEEVKF